MQRVSKQAFSTIERLFSAWFVPRSYKGTKKIVSESCPEFGRVLKITVEGIYEKVARKELDCAKKTHMWFDMAVRLL
jgi:hypothetical protein